MDQGRTYWWEEAKGTAHETIFNVLRFLGTNQGWIREGHLRSMRLYGNLNVLGLSAQTFSNNAAVNPPYDRLSLNIVQSMCDTVTQKIAKSRPRPMFLTDGGSWKMQEKAKLLNKFVDGQFYATGVYNFDVAAMAFRDATVFGSGFLKTYRMGNEIKVERVFPGSIQADESEGIYGKPRSLYQNAYVPKEYLEKLYPEFKAQIRSCKAAESPWPGHKNLSEHIWVAEAWHLASSKEAKDGRHIIAIENATLVDDENYDKTYFPFVKIDWSPRLLGYMGQGLAEQLTGLQVEINKILRTIQLSFHLLGVPKVYLEMGSKIVKAHLNNDVGGLVWYQGVKPEVIAPSPVAPELFMHLQSLYTKAYEVAGISQLSAQSKKPDGLDSGKALREFNSLESERFILAEQAWESAHLEIAKQMIDLAKEISADGEDYEVMVKDDDAVLKIKWSEINLEADQYMMQLYPTSVLSKTPAGKLQDVVELAQAGFIDKPNALKLLDFPDIKAWSQWQNAPIDDLKKQIDMIIYNGDYHSPEPFQDLQSGLRMFQSAYLWAKTKDVPEGRLELLRRWMSEASMMMQVAQASAAPAPQAQAMPAQPAAAPVNEMLPIA